MGQPGLLKTGGQQTAQILGGAGLHTGGEFLAQEFQKQFGHDQASESATTGARWPRARNQPSQQALASARTRPI
ncbi:unnamed protein product [Pararhodospirillum photometricum DSM 122]|uniref:Uncharacterized protein n=1 Tax=Pararhodospirillum photometricum DSM 122 TaxID=1150469 RepID=H6SKL3_PARPM|nr:unnamed protein product [Pararhodospirillum photometricum DSM 122]